MSKTVVFDAPEHHVLENFDEEGGSVNGGESFTVTDERLAELVAAHVPIKEVAQEIRKLSRQALEDLARESGIENPEAFGTKTELAEAIEGAPPDHTTT